MFITNEATERNYMISEAILQGESLADIGRMYGISSFRCLQILRSYCSKKDRDAYMSITGLISRPPRVNQLREYADVFMNNDYNENIITENSPVWRIKEFPGKVVNALEGGNVNTVAELLKLEVAMLKRIPNIGSVSINIIEQFKYQYRKQDAQLEL